LERVPSITIKNKEDFEEEPKEEPKKKPLEEIKVTRGPVDNLPPLRSVRSFNTNDKPLITTISKTNSLK
jgi:hypothetical protein